MKAEIRFAAAVLLLLGITIFQMAGLPQPVTGPAVNAALFTAALWLGPWYAVAVGMCTPVVAFARGILRLLGSDDSLHRWATVDGGPLRWQAGVSVRLRRGMVA